MFTLVFASSNSAAKCRASKPLKMSKGFSSWFNKLQCKKKKTVKHKGIILKTKSQFMQRFQRARKLCEHQFYVYHNSFPVHCKVHLKFLGQSSCVFIIVEHRSYHSVYFQTLALLIIVLCCSESVQFNLKFNCSIFILCLYLLLILYFRQIRNTKEEAAKWCVIALIFMVSCTSKCSTTNYPTQVRASYQGTYRVPASLLNVTTCVGSCTCTSSFAMCIIFMSNLHVLSKMLIFIVSVFIHCLELYFLITHTHRPIWYSILHAW